MSQERKCYFNLRHFSYRSCDRLPRRNVKSILSLFCLKRSRLVCSLVSCYFIPAFSGPAISCPANWSVNFTSVIFTSSIFSAPALPCPGPSSYLRIGGHWLGHQWSPWSPCEGYSPSDQNDAWHAVLKSTVLIAPVGATHCTDSEWPSISHVLDKLIQCSIR